MVRAMIPAHRIAWSMPRLPRSAYPDRTAPRWGFFVVCAFFALLIAPSEATAQDGFQTSARRVNLSGRMHIQYNTTSVTDSAVSFGEFEFRRSRLTFDVTITELVRLRWMIDFTEFNEVSLRDAYANVAFSRGFRLTIGQFKRPFDAFQLASSNRIAVIEREGQVRGVDDCGLGGLCSYQRLLVELQFAQRDLGVMVDGTNGPGTLQYFFSVTNGTGLNNPQDENGAKSLTGRVVHTTGSGIKIGLNGGLHDFVNPQSGQTEFAPAVGADLEIGRYQNGWHFFLGSSIGGNWTALDGEGNQETFVGGAFLASYYSPIELRNNTLGLEPMLRFDVSNPMLGEGTGFRYLVTPGAFLHFTNRNKVALNFDIWLPHEEPHEWALITQVYFEF